MYGVGINDSETSISKTINGKQTKCPMYQRWKDMLARCYSTKVQEKYPTYIGYTVTEEWLLFSNFRGWVVDQYHDGLELDKVIKVKGNKIYSPETCLFIPKTLNLLLTDHTSTRGEYPVGVYWHKETSKFMAQINYDGKKKYLGLFSTPEKASIAYQQAREAKLRQLINDDTYPIATQYLEQHI